MRKALAVLFALAALCGSTWVQSQVLPGFPPGAFQSRGALDASGGAGPGSCAESNAFFARTSGLDATHITNYDNLICGLVTDGTWTKFVGLWVFTTDTTTHALLNLVSATGNLTSSGSPTFSADNGYTGDGSVSILDSGINTSTIGTIGINNTTIGTCVLTSRTTAQTYIEVSAYDNVQGSEILPNWTANIMFFVINDGNYSSSGNANAQGSWVLTRRAADMTVYRYKNGATASNVGSDTPSGLPNSTFTILGRSVSGVPAFVTADQLAYAYLATGFDDATALSVYNRLHTYTAAYSLSPC